jgi:hypothetical protein
MLATTGNNTSLGGWMTTRLRLKICSLIALAIFLIQGCATLSKEECLSADWHTIGYEDGSRGVANQRIRKHREACAEHGIAPDFEGYMAGHREGVRQYCVPARGFSLGRSGKHYNGVCPTDLENAFLAAFDEGRAVYQMQKETKQLQLDVRQARSEQQTLIQEIESNEALIISDATSPNLRRELIAQNRKIEFLIEDKQLFIEQAEEDIDWLLQRIERKSSAYH